MSDNLTREERIRDIFLSSDALGDVSNDVRGARVLAALLPLYDSDAVSALGDALADLRHAADLLGVSFGAMDREAQRNYVGEVAEHGVAQII